MSTTTNWPIQSGADDWFRQTSKRLNRMERMSAPTSAADLLGPGMSSQAVQIIDWNDEIATFNGFFYTLAGAYNTPEIEVYDHDPVTGMPVGEPTILGPLPWTGAVIAREDGSGMQQVWNTDEPDSMFFRVRNYWPNPDDPGAPVVFSGWQRFATPSGFVEGDDLAPEVSQGIQDTYEAANEAALAAEDAAANATTALAAANGKNKVTYSLLSPGVTANTAGDIWFRKESTTQTVIEQWEGLGGTSWSQKTLANAVIANLDAGKLTAGSAFTNALSVKTLFTLGDAATNGIIQSYNFAGSPVGIYIDKFGFIAKGGTITGATVDGGTVTGATVNGGIVQTAASGERVALEGTNKRLAFYTPGGALAASLSFGGIFGLLVFGDITGGFSRWNEMVETPLLRANTLQPTTAAGISVEASWLSMNGWPINAVSGLNNGGGDIVMDATIKPDECYLTTSPAAAPGTAVYMGASGRLYKTTSSLRYKDNVEDADIDLGAVKAVRLRQFTYRPEYTDTPDRVLLGGIAEEFADSGMEEFVSYDDQGRPDSIDYARLVIPLFAWLREVEQRLDAAGL